MNADNTVPWRTLSRAVGLRVSGLAIDVPIEGARRQTIQVIEDPDGSFRLHSVVARQSVVRRLRTPLLDAWHRNRFSEFVDFSVDERGRLVGQTAIPPMALTKYEWEFYVTTLAKACDRFEYLLTGSDES